MTEKKYNTKDIRHIDEKDQEYIAEGNRMTKEIKIGKKDVVACNYWEACDYYKQLKRLEQENKELKEENESFMNGDYCADGCKKMNNAFCDAHTIIINENNKFRSALEEIREKVKNPITLSCFASAKFVLEQIDKKINEVLNDK